VVPDYANAETTINRISTPTGSWTVDRTGFVIVRHHAAKNQATAFFALRVLINGVVVASAWSDDLDIERQSIDDIYPVTAGDVIEYILEDFTGDLSDLRFSTYCWFVPPKFVSTTAPVVSDDFMNVAMTPDYSSPTVLLSTPAELSGSGNVRDFNWTANRTGYLRYEFYVKSSTSNVYVAINPDDGLGSIMQGSAVLNTIQYIAGIWQISEGDSILLRCATDSTASGALTVDKARVVFYPGKFVSTTAPNIVISGASYSTTEQKTGETWIDGKPIYRQAFVGSVTGAVDTTIVVNLITANIDELVSSGGWWITGDPAKLSANTTNLDYDRHASVYVNNNMLRWASNCEVERTSTNNTYKIWAEYTKTTD
jgi:hypothetical protein